MSSDALHRIIKQARLEEEPLFLGDASARSNTPVQKDLSLERLAEEQYQQKLLEAEKKADYIMNEARDESEVVNLVLQTVRKILKIEPIINEQVLIRVIRDALERLGQKVDVHIDVNPQDLELLHFSLTQIEDLALEIVIDTDAKIEPGGCRIQSKAGEIDARLSTQFDAIAQSFLALADGTEQTLTGEEYD